MNTQYLQPTLLAFACVFYAVAFLWSELRKRKLAIAGNVIFKNSHNKSLYKTDKAFKILGVFFIFMIICYVAMPVAYKFFIPIKSLDNPLLDAIGLLILNISLVWIVVAQLDIDKELYRYNNGIGGSDNLQSLQYAEKKLISGLLIMFIGAVVTLSNIIGSALVIVALIIYKKNVRNLVK
ncbi:MAG TPA: hypothetical protein VN721_12200 [Flavipsychrobacter sp.]|nr:hypothetical protein [Flavipsychrobacter sp.]